MITFYGWWQRGAYGVSIDIPYTYMMVNMKTTLSINVVYSRAPIDEKNCK